MRAKLSLLAMLFFGSVLLTSCSNEAEEIKAAEPSTTVSDNTIYNYNATELETLTLINDYRKSIGLNTLEKLNFISLKSEEHANYMITNNVVNHDDFTSRANEIIRVFGAKNVSENIAYNYISPIGALDAWLKSSSHRENIVGNFTHFGIAVKQDPITGKKYYVNIFAKI